MRLFGGKKERGPHLDREAALSAKPVLNRLVKLQRAEDGTVLLQIPRGDTAMAKTMARIFGIPSYKKVALDELGTFVIELCDGRHTVKDLVDKLAKRYKLNYREAEASTSSFLRNLGRRSIIGMVIEGRDVEKT